MQQFLTFTKVENGMKNNLELHKQITFDELVKHGLENGANVVNGMPWSWKINGKSITHENDNCYLIETIDGSKRFERGDHLIAFERGLHIFPLMMMVVQTWFMTDVVTQIFQTILVSHYASQYRVQAK